VSVSSEGVSRVEVLTEAMTRLRDEIVSLRRARAAWRGDLVRQVSALRADFASDRAGAHRAWFYPVRSAPVRSAPVRSAPVRSAPARSAPAPAAARPPAEPEPAAARPHAEARPSVAPSHAQRVSFKPAASFKATPSFKASPLGKTPKKH